MLVVEEIVDDASTRRSAQWDLAMHDDTSVPSYSAGDVVAASEVCDGWMTSTSRPRVDGEASLRAEARLRELAASVGTPRRPDLHGPARTVVPFGLDERADALVRLAALVAMSAPATAYPDIVGGALAGGATTEEIIGTMVSVASTVGISRVVPGTAGLALGLGYDVEAALERRDEPAPPLGTRRDG